MCASSGIRCGDSGCGCYPVQRGQRRESGQARRAGIIGRGNIFKNNAHLAKIAFSFDFVNVFAAAGDGNHFHQHFWRGPDRQAQRCGYV